MQVPLPRSEILRLVRAHLGFSTGNQLSLAVNAQHVAVVNAAALKVQQECGWINALARMTITLGAEQDVINLPTGCKPGCIRSMAVYDQDKYWPLEPRVIPVQADTDQEMIVGQPTLARVLGRPKYYQERSGQLYLWPRSDQTYPIRFEYLKSAEMVDDGDVSPYDGPLIVYAAAAMLAIQMESREQAQHYSGLYNDRMMALRGWQQEGTRFAIDSEADLGENEFVRDELLPNWNRGPTAPGNTI